MISLEQIHEHERQARNKEQLTEIGRQHRLVSNSAHQALRFQQERNELQRDLTQLEKSNPIPTDDNQARATTSGLFAFFVLAAYVIDFALAAPLLQEMTEDAVLRLILKVAMPAMLVIAEIAVSIRRFLAQDEQKSAGLLTFIGVLFAMVMPGLVLSTQLAIWIAEEQSSPATNVMIISKIASLTALSLGVHVFLLFSGRQLYEAKVYLFVGRRRNSLRNRIRRLDRAYTEAIDGTAADFLDYDRVRKAGNIGVESFDERTMEILNNAFRQNSGAAGQRENNEPNDKGGGAGAASPPPDPGPEGNPGPHVDEHPENDYHTYESELHI
jgi:hypothetical protein